MVVPPDIETLWAAGPPSNMSLGEWLRAMVMLEWRGADEPVQTVSSSIVGCVCGQQFIFKDGAPRARCPGCGCRYERKPQPLA